MSVVIGDENFHGNETTILKEMKRTLEPDRVELLPKMALIATVGEGMAYRVGVAGQLFAALREAKVTFSVAR